MTRARVPVKSFLVGAGPVVLALAAALAAAKPGSPAPTPAKSPAPAAATPSPARATPSPAPRPSPPRATPSPAPAAPSPTRAAPSPVPAAPSPASAAPGAAPPRPAETPAEAPVWLRGVELFVLRAPFGSLSPAERAELASRKLDDALRDPQVAPEQVITVPAGRMVLIEAGARRILEVTPADAAAYDSTPAVLADHWAGLIRSELGRRKSEAFTLVLIGRFILGMLYPVAILLVLWVGLLLLDRAREWVELRPAETLPVVRLLGLEVLGPLTVRRLQLRLLGLLRATLYLGLGYAFLLALFSRFPQTQLHAQRMIGFVLDALGGGLAEILTWLPRILAGLIIVAAARLLIRLTGLLFGRVQAGRLTLPPFLTADTAAVSEAIVRAAVILVATALLALLVPGERGRPVLAALFLVGLVGALALAPAARQLTAGILLAYVRPAPAGSRVEIEGKRGTVVRRGTFHTILAADSGEEIWVPNHAILTGRVTRLAPAPASAAPGGTPPGAAPPDGTPAAPAPPGGTPAGAAPSDGAPGAAGGASDAGASPPRATPASTA